MLPVSEVIMFGHPKFFTVYFKRFLKVKANNTHLCKALKSLLSVLPSIKKMIPERGYLYETN
jgi:hypothetical protein